MFSFDCSKLNEPNFFDYRCVPGAIWWLGFEHPTDNVNRQGAKQYGGDEKQQNSQLCGNRLLTRLTVEIIL